MSQIKNWVHAFRPKTLTAAVVPILVASGMAKFYKVNFDLKIMIFALLSALCIQIATNLINDAMDFKKGADTNERLGPKRVTLAGDFTFQKVMMMGWIFVGLAVAFGIPLVLKGGWPIVVIGLLSLIFAFAYTSGPLPLAYKGLGDLFVIIFFGIVAVMGMYFLYSGEWTTQAFIAGLQIGMLSCILIAVNNLRDMDSDRKAGKMTLPARFGLSFGRYEILVLTTIGYFLCVYWLKEFANFAAVLPFFALVPSSKVIKEIFEYEPSTHYNQILAKAAQAHIVFGILMAVGFIWQ